MRAYDVDSTLSLRETSSLNERTRLSQKNGGSLLPSPRPSPNPLPKALTYLTDQKVRGAHEGIKPGVELSGTPGHGLNQER